MLQVRCNYLFSNVCQNLSGGFPTIASNFALALVVMHLLKSYGGNTDCTAIKLFSDCAFVVVDL